MRFWSDLTTVDFKDMDPERVVALAPLGAVEQHGPHLPLSTDAIIAEEIAIRGAAGTDADVLILPTSHIGKSTEHLDYPGTLTLSTETLLHFWTEIGESVARTGLRKIVFVNAHGGQPQVMQIVARELRVRCGMLAVSANWWECGYPDGLLGSEEAEHGIHGGQSETSVMLHLRPELVRMDHAEDFRPSSVDVHASNKVLRLTGAPAAAWMAQDLHPAGVAGNASVATAETGKQIVEAAAAGLAALLTETAAYPLANLRE